MYLTKTKKSPFYQISFERDGKFSTVSTRTKIKAEALRFLSEFEKNSRKEIKVEPASLIEFEQKYLDYIKGIRSKNYCYNVKVGFTQFKKYIDESVLLKNITVKDIDSFVSKVYKEAPHSAASYYRILKASFNKAILWNYISVNPFSKIKPPKVKKSFPVFINEVDLQIILDNTKEQLFKDLFLFAFHTGMRESEILSLEWSSINLRDKIIIVSNTKTFTTKSKKERIIPINKRVYEILLSRLPAEDQFNIFSKKSKNSLPEYVFSRIKGIKLNLDFVSKKFKKTIRKANLNDSFHFHSLRHSFASGLVQKGVSLLIVKELLGHSDLRVTQIYSHLQNADLVNAVELLAS